ncbi:E3 ubiquitin-protein ligase MARCHF2-like [Haemaphysalis longicornis]
MALRLGLSGRSAATHAGSIGFAHKPCMERWVSERREEECNICHFNYPIVRKKRTLCELLRHPEGRKEPLVYVLLGVIFSMSLLHVFAFAWMLSVRTWGHLPWPYQLLNAAALVAQAALWAIFPFVAFRMAWESSRRWCLLNAELRIVLPETGAEDDRQHCAARKAPAHRGRAASPPAQN